MPGHDRGCNKGRTFGLEWVTQAKIFEERVESTDEGQRKGGERRGKKQGKRVKPHYFKQKPNFEFLNGLLAGKESSPHFVTVAWPITTISHPCSAPIRAATDVLPSSNSFF